MNIQIAFRYGSRDWFTKLICLWQGGDSAHCEVSIARAGGKNLCISSSFVDGGVRQALITLSPDKWRIYEMQVDRAEAERWYEAHKGQNYDILGLLGFIFRPMNGARRKWFCSEAAAAILGLLNPERYDLVLLESYCKRTGTRVQ